MEKDSGIHLVNKEIGQTPLEVIERFKKDNPEYKDEKMTYAGRLDPMAEGLLVLLSGDKVNDKEKFLDLNKVYETEVLWGFKTDTLDLLGIAGNYTDKHPEELEVKNYIEKSIGKFSQAYPEYSSKTVSGKPLFEWAREGKISDIIIPTHEVEIFETEFLERREIGGVDLLYTILGNIIKVSGDFRQEEIKINWKQLLHRTERKKFTIDKIKLTVSSGFYIRQYIKDLAESLNCSALAFSIKRTKIGDYKL